MTSLAEFVIAATNKRRRQTEDNVPSSYPPIKSHPNYLLAEVVGRIAAGSFDGLYSLKLCSKDFLQAMKDNCVFQKVTLEKFPYSDWFLSDKKTLFLKRCMDSGNLKSLYREGLQQLFGYKRRNTTGILLLDMDVAKGHIEAKYVVGMLLLRCTDEECRKQGIRHMNFFGNNKCVTTCRKNLQQKIRFMWFNNGVVVRTKSHMCNSKTICEGWRMIKNKWLILDLKTMTVSLANVSMGSRAIIIL